MQEFIYKVLTKSEWEGMQRDGSFAGSALDQRDKFIHCSHADQWPGVVERYFKDIRPLYLLRIDVSLLPKDLLKVENNRPGGDEYPHLYAPLPLKAAILAQTIE